MSWIMRRKEQAQRLGVSVPWLVAAACMVLFIWGNSMVPGDASSQLSHGVLRAVRDILCAWGLPADWLTNFIVRKIAHFSEYAVLGVCVAQGIDPGSRATRRRLLLMTALLVLAPSIDETIQLFVTDRAGQVIDVVLDCCGAAFGVAVRSVACALVRRRNRR